MSAGDYDMAVFPHGGASFPEDGDDAARWVASMVPAPALRAVPRKPDPLDLALRRADLVPSALEEALVSAFSALANDGGPDPASALYNAAMHHLREYRARESAEAGSGAGSLKSAMSALGTLRKLPFPAKHVKGVSDGQA